MGKWHGGGGGGGANNLASCREHGVVIGTCDSARERETSKELVNLFNQIIDDMNISTTTASSSSQPPQEKLSVQDMLARELSEVRAQRSTSTQNVMSINTDTKGVVCIKFLRGISPTEIVLKVFERVQQKKEACTRHAVRIVPLEHTFFPNQEELDLTLKKLCLQADHQVESNCDIDVEEIDEPKNDEKLTVDEQNGNKRKLESSEETEPSLKESRLEPLASLTSLPTKQVTYTVLYKSRNHNVLNRQTVTDAVAAIVPSNFGLRYKDFQVVFMVETLMNLGGATRVDGTLFQHTHEFNIRKFQQQYAGDNNASTSITKGNATKTAIVMEKVNDNGKDDCVDAGLKED